MPREFSNLELQARSWFGFNKPLFFILLCVVYLLLFYVQQNFIVDEIAAFKFLEGPQALIFKIIASLNMLSIPVVYAIKFTIVGFVLWVGCFMWGYNVNFYKCWNIAMIAELVFFVPTIIKIFWFMFIETDPTYWEYDSFYPLSLMNFYEYSEVPKKYWYVNQQLNVFELAYWVVLTYGVDFTARKKKSVANAIVATSYVPLFLLWLWFYLGVAE
ncbi:hypothetical protein [Roseivirga thermotolerans]|uniref:Sulfate ABC transporter permease n=1 Tax=Roseivirga thermotolerans TaxID=1758176 RepID=A0ABQ3I533_9BACT|nr:hypothetical protein [Roseivirga thermotolerans]GHE51548.1 hypothetical protein GCM10011340_02140 [Roseivirga thermotolerans]